MLTSVRGVLPQTLLLRVRRTGRCRSGWRQALLGAEASALGRTRSPAHAQGWDSHLAGELGCGHWLAGFAEVAQVRMVKQETVLE